MLFLPALLPSLASLLAPQGDPARAPRTSSAPLGGVDVPLVRLAGVAAFNTYGASFLDFDGDGWIDLYVNSSAGLWHNEAGQTFVRVADLDDFLPPIVNRYGASCGDYDNDGLPDIACSPRGDCFFLLRNVDGAGTFTEVASDPAVLDDRLSCNMYGETYAWADVDEDGDLDLWITAYPDRVQDGSGGNQFLENLGPTGPGGAYRFSQQTPASGLAVPDNTNRPEGAQFVDVDRDGDTDAYANGTLYQNVSGPGLPRFDALVRTTGILMNNALDEGAMFFDYDLDGDVDLVCVYGTRNVLWENEGDGTFFDGSERLDRPLEGAGTGCSAEDWDLDGDLDLTTTDVFRRNLLVETGEPFLRRATHAIPDTFLGFPVPCWGDFDKDGDADCALANFAGRSAFFTNTTYGPDTPELARTSVRVRPVRDSASVARGLETEFGATVEVRPRGDVPGRVRRRFVASSHGYLQQSEYALTLALPPGPDPLEPARGVVFDLLVDFPSLPENGLVRIDKSVNPVLGGLALEALADREITVFRSGIVRIDGVDHARSPRFSPRLLSSGRLVEASLAGGPPPAVEPAPGPNGFVGMELDTLAAADAVRVQELVLDGELATPAGARCDANVRLYEVTPGKAPHLVLTERLTTSPRNDRSFLAVDWLLKPGRVFRVVCLVTERRASPLTAALAALTNRGAFAGSLAEPCDKLTALGAALDPAQAFLELRYHAAALTLSGQHR